MPDTHVSKSRLQGYVKFIKDDPECFAELMERVEKALFDKWLIASDDDSYRIIRDIHSNKLLFVTEINKVFESIDEDKSINDSDENHGEEHAS